MFYRKLFQMMIFLILIIYSHSQQITLSVSQLKLLEVNISIRNLQQKLNIIDNLKKTKKQIIQLWKRVELTKIYLLELNKQLGDFDNHIQGTDNQVKGYRNVIIGDYNKIQGSNNWVFISEFKGKVSDNLIVNKWRVELGSSELILINPTLVISYIDEEKNQEFMKIFKKNKKNLIKWEEFGEDLKGYFDMKNGQNMGNSAKQMKRRDQQKQNDLHRAQNLNNPTSKILEKNRINIFQTQNKNINSDRTTNQRIFSNQINERFNRLFQEKKNRSNFADYNYSPWRSSVKIGPL